MRDGRMGGWECEEERKQRREGGETRTQGTCQPVKLGRNSVN